MVVVASAVVLGTVALVWLETGMGDVVFKGTAVWLNDGVGTVLLTSVEGLETAAVTLEVGAGAVPLSENVGIVVAVEFAGKVGRVKLAENVPLAVGMAELEPLTDTGAGEVVFVRRGGPTAVVFEGTSTPVVEAVALVGSGIIRVVEFRGRTTLVEGSADADELPVGIGDIPVPLPNVGRVGKVPLEVVLEMGNGAVVLAEPGTGPSNVVEFSGTVMVVTTAVPLTVVVVTMAVTAPVDIEGGDVVLKVGKGVRRVAEFTGMRTLVAVAEPLTLTVDALAIIVELAGVAASGTVVTADFEVVLAKGDGT